MHHFNWFHLDDTCPRQAAGQNAEWVGVDCRSTTVAAGMVCRQQCQRYYEPVSDVDAQLHCQTGGTWRCADGSNNCFNFRCQREYLYITTVCDFRKHYGRSEIKIKVRRIVTSQTLNDLLHRILHLVL